MVVKGDFIPEISGNIFFTLKLQIFVIQVFKECGILEVFRKWEKWHCIGNQDVLNLI